MIKNKEKNFVSAVIYIKNVETKIAAFVKSVHFLQCFRREKRRCSGSVVMRAAHEPDFFIHTVIHPFS